MHTSLVTYSKRPRDAHDVAMTTCPYCESESACPHLLLIVDTTFRCAHGGPLYEVFDKRWQTLWDAHGEEAGFDERRHFDELLQQVQALADTQMGSGSEGGPGQSSTYRRFYCASPERVARAVKEFGRRAGGANRA